MALTKAEQYFERCVVDDLDIITGIGELAAKDVKRYFNIKLGNYKVPIAIYSLVFECILKHLKSLQKTKESHSIIIANRLEIGFTTSFETEENSDLEKFGNFSIYMKHIHKNKLTEVDEYEKKTLTRCVQWNESNITTSINDIKDITKMAMDRMSSELDIQLVNPEIIMPVFCTIHDDIINYTMLKYKSEENEDSYGLSADIAGCYRIYIMQLEDGMDISFKPGVYSKGTIKEDGDATTKHE